jgi:hypothetical protein
MGRTQLRLFAQQLEHDGRARQGGQKTYEQRLAQSHSEDHEGQLQHGDGQENLRRPAHENRFLETLQFVQGQFHADDEKEQDHPYLGEYLDLVRIIHKSKPVRPRQHARSAESRSRAGCAGDGWRR